MLRSTIFALALASMTLAPAAQAQSLTTELFVQGVSGPTYMTQAPGDPSRFFIVEQVGRIRVVLNGALLATPFIDLRPAAGGPVLSGGERGLLGLAFHPDYQNNGRFFVNYTGAGAGNTFVVEYGVTGDPNVASPTPVQTIIQVNQDFSNHNGGCIQFGPDGKLYVGMGDGGSGNDPNGRAQSQTSNLGKMLRFDVDIPAPFIPGDNPFVGAGGYNDEIWFVGLRNPWRWSFDRLTGDMYIGDVGQGAREEVDFAPAGVGGLNFGWRCMEGFACTGLTGCTCNSTALTLPFHDYTHAGGNCSITGGYNYRGSAIPSLNGTYFFADYCSSKIWSISYDPATGTASPVTDRTLELRPTSGGTITSIVSFAEDLNGELYIVEQGGQIWKIVQDCGATTYCQAQANSTGNAAFLTTAGSLSIADNNLTISCNALPAFSAGIFFYGGAQVAVPNGQGLTCVGGSATQPAIRMAPVLVSDLLGGVNRAIDFTAPQQSVGAGAILPGQSWNFQYWYRDSVGGQATWNYSNAVSLFFCP
ncbi:MAG: PQQ-dependent sugar dehydrogenase [Planctomycetota bacterium]